MMLPQRDLIAENGRKTSHQMDRGGCSEKQRTESAEYPAT